MARAKSVPNIYALQKSLGYADAAAPEHRAFYSQVEAFRTSFQTTKGRQGSKLLVWKRDRRALREMSFRFLEQNEAGPRFWLGKDTLSGHRLRYSVDGARIQDLMTQLFWRINLQQKTKHYTEFPSVADITRGLIRAHRLTYWVYENPGSHCTLWVPSGPILNKTLRRFEAKLPVSLKPTDKTYYQFIITAGHAYGSTFVFHGREEEYKLVRTSLSKVLYAFHLKKDWSKGYQPDFGRMEIKVLHAD